MSADIDDRYRQPPPEELKRLLQEAADGPIIDPVKAGRWAQLDDKGNVTASGKLLWDGLHRQ